MKNENDSEFCIIRRGERFVVNRKIEEPYGFLWLKKRKVWRAVTTMGHIAFGSFKPAFFSTKAEAKKMVEALKKEDEVDYL